MGPVGVSSLLWLTMPPGGQGRLPLALVRLCGEEHPVGPSALLTAALVGESFARIADTADGIAV